MAADRRPPGRADDIDETTVALHFETARPDLARPAGLGALLRDRLASARAAWPELALPPDVFVRFVAERLPEGEPVAEALTAMHTDDLYLTCACSRGDAGALALFDRVCQSATARALGRLGGGAERLHDEVRQRVRGRLLLPRDGAKGGAAPRVADFSGKSALGAWVRVVATREALNLLRSSGREATLEDDFARDVGAAAEPELAYFKRLYRDEFKAAFDEALAGLSRRERTLLRQHALDGLSIDRLAALYGVHRATAARWVEAARSAVLDHTRRALARRLRLRPAELDSVVRLIHSQLDVTLSPLLRDSREGDEAGPSESGGPGGGGAR